MGANGLSWGWAWCCKCCCIWLLLRPPPPPLKLALLWLALALDPAPAEMADRPPADMDDRGRPPMPLLVFPSPKRTSLPAFVALGLVLVLAWEAASASWMVGPPPKEREDKSSPMLAPPARLLPGRLWLA